MTSNENRIGRDGVMVDAGPVIVGIGASAGGIPALEAFFSQLPDDTGMGFIIVTHLSPTRESLLHEVLERYTSLPVMVAQDGVRIMPDTVHVMPQNVTLSINQGVLKVTEDDGVHRERKPIDVLLSSLAEDQGENAVGIILSGGDSDGTIGVKAIKEHGGITMAQMPDGAGPKNPEMPESAIASGLIDFAVPAEAMPARLLQIKTMRHQLGDLVPHGEQDALGPDLRRVQMKIAKLLRSHSGHDFSGYKDKTFFRRVARRMQVTHVTTLDGYIDLLQSDPAEAMALFRDLLINVTDFFRDVDAFDVLRDQVIPRLFEGRGADETIRVWVPGCATGEEVYSIGILLAEHVQQQSRPQVQIFATDIDEPALAVARAARYPAQFIKNLDPVRRERFFTKDGASYVLSKEVRDMCIFSPHSVISDPPFSRMDLVSCRNLLIYLGPDLQRQVIPTFHYALKPGGYLFLGTSESIGQHTDLFRPLDKKHRVFQSLDHGGRRPRLPMALDRMTMVPTRLKGAGGDDASGYQLRQRTDAQVLERHAPAHVVVRKEGDVVFYSARTGRYLEPPRGAPSRQLLDLVRQELRAHLRKALGECIETRRKVVRHAFLHSASGEDGQMVSITIEPLDGQDRGEDLFLILFHPVGDDRTRRERPAGDGAAPDDGAADRDLNEIRERLQSTIEEYETALEELKSANEELVSVNEEAQSTNEELEASKEEMQSLNEELSTINAELNSKVEELARANTDLENLYDATRIATVFLDAELVIRNFTPAASAFFNLRPSDIGRPLTELASVVDYPLMRDHIRSVFETGEMVEHRLHAPGNREHYLVRLVPYRDNDGSITGVVVTFVEISSLAEAEQQQKVLIAELNHRVKNMLAVVISITKTTRDSSNSIEEFTSTLVGRMHGMARAYGLLSARSWTSVSIGDLIGQEIATHGSERIVVNGPDVQLKPQQALSLGMVIHELATNAAKYGALSSKDGSVRISWDVSDDVLRLTWAESGGPSVLVPEQKGFGLVLIEGQIRHQLKGDVRSTFRPEGFEIELSVELGN
jgi:two-component system, chemotaxis family, CheB/CheR fusion protein